MEKPNSYKNSQLRERRSEGNNVRKSATGLDELKQRLGAEALRFSVLHQKPLLDEGRGHVVLAKLKPT